MTPEPDQHKQHTPEKWLTNRAKAVRRQLTTAVVWAFCSGITIVLQARLLAQACHLIAIDHAPYSAIIPLAAVVATVAICRGVLIFLSERQAFSAAAAIKSDVRNMLYRKIQLLAPTGQLGEDTAPLVEATTAAVEALEAYIARFIPQLVLAALIPVTALLFVLPAEWRGGIVLFFSAPFIPLLMILIGRGSEKLHRRQWTTLSRMSGQLLDLIQGLPDLKIFGAVKREAAAVERVSEEYRQRTMSVLRIAFLSAFTLEFFSSIGTAVVAVIIGFRLLEGNLGLADGLFVLLLAPEFYLPLRNLGLSYHSRLQGIAAAERIAPLMQLPEPQGYDGILPAPATAPEIVLEDVCFRYSGDRGGVTGVSLTIPAAGITALSGASGSGKTTLARLIIGLTRPQQGRITVNGIDLARISPDSWQSGLAWVPQKAFFFKGTIRDNLLLGCPNADDEQIRQALQSAAAGFILERPAGLETELGDRGAGLSGGEQRRLALARAFLRNASLVVLDEPTAGLDSQNEQLVVQAIANLSISRTVLLISHREDTVAMANQIATLVDGRLDRIVTASRPDSMTGGKA
jgi:ATP-binding cassette, subfamily C, bacterial CydD